MSAFHAGFQGDERFFPYGRREGKGKGKGKRRTPPEDKALLNTQCFYNMDGDFIVRLYDTEVFVLKKRTVTQANVPAADKPDAGESQSKVPESAPKAVPEGEKVAEKVAEKVPDAAPANPQDANMTENAAPAAAPAEPEDANSAGDAPAKPKDADMTEDASAPVGTDEAKARPEGATAPATEVEAKAAPAETPPAAANGAKVAQAQAPQAPVVIDVLVLNSGNFRTIETRYIINEASQPLSLRISETGRQGGWTVMGGGKPVPFEDGLQVSLAPNPNRTAVVKEHMESRIREARAREARARDEMRSMEFGRGDFGYHGMPANRGYPGGPFPGMPPFGWHGQHPANAWRGRNGSGPQGRGAPGNWDGPAAARAAAGLRPGEPLPDDMFQ